ncbi:MAG: glycosyltransferase [Patescibacteria group bacterium]
MEYSENNKMRNRKIHVVQIGYDDSPFDQNPASDTLRRQAAYAEELARKAPESRLTILTLTKQRAALPRNVGNAHFIPVSYPHWPLIPFRVLDALKKLHATHPISVISTQTPHEDGFGALLFRRQTGIPVIAQIHYDIFDRRAERENIGRGLSRLIRRTLTWRCLPRFNALRTDARQTTERFREAGIHSRIHALPIPAMMLLDGSRHISVKKEPRVLYVGRLARQKRIDRWLMVARRIVDRFPDAQFDIIGDGPLRDQLERFAKNLGLSQNVRFHGAIAHDALNRFYESAKIFLLTSDYEGFPRVIIEAAFHGIPVISTRITDAHHAIIDGRTGFILDRDDIAGMAQRVMELLGDETRRYEMGISAQTYVAKEFPPRRLIEQWVNILLSPLASTTPQSQILPKRLTIARLKYLSKSRNSLLRTLQYEVIEKVTLSGKTLDLGGGRRSDYIPLLRVIGSIESVNIDSSMQPTYIADLNQTLPLSAETFDNLISLNTFEHVFNDVLALREALRVLKHGGRFHILIPFLYKTHGSPNDFHRHTASWWEKQITENGGDPSALRIEPLVIDSLSSGMALSNFGGRRWLRWLVLSIALLRQRRMLLDLLVSYKNAESALGWYITGTKL